MTPAARSSSLRGMVIRGQGVGQRRPDLSGFAGTQVVHVSARLVAPGPQVLHAGGPGGLDGGEAALAASTAAWMSGTASGPRPKPWIQISVPTPYRLPRPPIRRAKSPTNSRTGRPRAFQYGSVARVSRPGMLAT